MTFGQRKPRPVWVEPSTSADAAGPHDGSWHSKPPSTAKSFVRKWESVTQLFVVTCSPQESGGCDRVEYAKALASGFGGSDTSPNTDSRDRASDDDDALG